MPTVRRKNKRVKKKTALKFIIIGAVILFIFFILDSQVKPVITSMSSYFVKQYATNEINYAISQAINETGTDYDDIVKIEKDNDGNVISVQTKAQKITLLHTKITTLVNEKLSKLQNNIISIPLGSLSGIAFLSGRGPSINIKMLPRGNASSEIISDLSEAGINQTLHTINAKIKVDISSIVPLFSSTNQVDVDCMIAQSVIVGNVPNYYTKVVSKNSDDITTDISKYGNPRFSSGETLD